jgi:hypothetical protein
VPIDENLVRLLRQWLKKRARQKEASDSSFLFLALCGTQCNRNTFGQIFRKMQTGHGQREANHSTRSATCIRNVLPEKRRWFGTTQEHHRAQNLRDDERVPSPRRSRDTASQGRNW